MTKINMTVTQLFLCYEKTLTMKCKNRLIKNLLISKNYRLISPVKNKQKKD